MGPSRDPAGVSEINLANKQIFNHAKKRDFNHADKQTSSSFRLSKRPAVPREILPEVPAQSDRDFVLFNPEKFFKPSYLRLLLVSLSTQADFMSKAPASSSSPSAANSSLGRVLVLSLTSLLQAVVDRTIQPLAAHWSSCRWFRGARCPLLCV